jgi:RNA methyltransferase, TrmH family
MITSTHNPRIQWVRKLQEHPPLRQSEGVFVIEGVRLVEEAVRAGWQPSLVLYTPDLSQRGLEIIRSLSSSILEEVSPAVMRSASDTQTPQGLLAVMVQRVLPLPAALDFVLVLDAIRDPGNLGTILRTAVAAGTQGVILAPDCVAPFSPKVLRSAMGAHFRLPVLVLEWSEIEALLDPGVKIYLSDVGDSLLYTQVDFRSPAALIIGGEAQGAGTEAHRLAQERIHIPMAPGVESLNAAAAAAVLMFEVVRQRNL